MSKDNDRETQSRENDEHHKAVEVGEKVESQEIKRDPIDNERKLEAGKIIGNG